MRALKYLVSRDFKDSLDANPTFQWTVSIFLLVSGVLFVVKGVKGFQEKRLTGKRGREFEGTTAQALGIVWIIIGALMAIMPLGIKLGALMSSQ